MSASNDKEVIELVDENYEMILNNMGDPVFVKDDQSRLILVNDAFCEVFGRSRAEIIGKTLAEDASPEEQEHFLKIDRQVIADGKESIVEELLTIGGGETRTISTRKTRFIDKQGNKFLVGVIRDITERKNAFELDRFNKYNEFLLRAAQILSQPNRKYQVALKELAESVSLYFGVVCDISILNDETGVICPEAIYHPNKDIRHIILNLFEQRTVRRGEGLVGSVINTGNEVLIRDVPEEMKVGPRKVDPRIIATSIMYVPLSGTRGVFGALNLTRLEGQKPFSDIEINQIRRLGEYVSLFVENGLLKEEQFKESELRKVAEQQLESEKSWAEFKLEISRLLAGVDAELEFVVGGFTERVADYFDVVCDVQLVNHEMGSIRLEAIHHSNPEVKSALEKELTNRELKIGEGMVGKVVESGKELFISELPAELLQKAKDEKVNPLVIPSSFVYIPVKGHGRVLGTIDFTRLTGAQPLVESDLNRMRDLAQHVARFIENRLLQAEQKKEIQLRKKAEQRSERSALVLERMEAETRAILNAVPIYIARISKDLRYLFFNEAYRNRGIDPRTSEGKRVVDVVGQDVLDELMVYVEDVLKGNIVNYEYENTMNDGVYRYFNVVLSPEFAEDGSVIGFYSCSTDMTTKVLAEREAQLTQDRLESLSLNSGDAFFFHDLEHNILDVNQVATDMLGYSREEFLKMKAHQIDPVWNGNLYQKFLKSLDVNTPHTFETTILGKNGNEIPVESRFVKRVERGKTYIQSLIRDRTEKKQQEEKLKHSEERLRLVFENVEDIISVHDEEGIFESVNKVTQGNSEDDVIGTSVFDIYDEQRAKEIRIKYENLKKTGESFEIEQSYKGPDGSTISYVAKFLAIFHDEKFFKAIVIVRDVTAERSREQSVMNAVLRGQEQERKRLGADLHDGIGQVLSAIGLEVSQLKEKLINEETDLVKEKLASLNESLQDAIHEVRNISHDLMPEVVESFGLKEAINQTCSNLHGRAGINVKFNHVDLENRYEALLELNLYRITQELLANVQKHAQSKNVFVSLMDYGKSLSLTVEDDGVGFNTKEDFKGIGLKNIQSRLKMMGGTIDMESDPNSGTLINIEVPKQEK